MNSIKENGYYSWFTKLVNVLIRIFLIFSFVSLSYLVADRFNFEWKTYVFIASIVLSFVVLFLFRNKLKDVFELIEKQASSLNKRTMVIILMALMVILRLLYNSFLYFDSTVLNGDIDKYVQVANDIYNYNLSSAKYNLAYVLGFSCQLAWLRKKGISYIVSIFLFFFIGTLCNFNSFTKIVGKEKAFIVTVFYILMPSTILWTFCITHEVALYFYLSILFNLFTSISFEEKTIYAVIKSLLASLFLVLCYMVSPMANIVFIFLYMREFLTKRKLIKKVINTVMITVILIISINVSNSMEFYIRPNKLNEKSVYHSLICGSNTENYGRFITYDEDYIDLYLKENNLSEEYKNIKPIQKEILLNQYTYLIKNPLELLKLIANKFYISWSGNYYSVELAKKYHLFYSGIPSEIVTVDYILMIIGTAIYSIFLCLGIISTEENNDSNLLNYKILLLGVVCVLLLTEIMNKYSQYMMIFILFISVSNYDKIEKKRRR